MQPTDIYKKITINYSEYVVDFNSQYESAIMFEIQFLEVWNSMSFSNFHHTIDSKYLKKEQCMFSKAKISIVPA